ncbi:MAG TPA: Fe-S cluster assembly ATPase SufC [Patescibacteria group bacterium]
MNKKLIINNLHVETKEGKKILNGLSLTINSGEIHAVMGPNGGGKSTFAQSLMGHPGYVITQGSIVLNGTDITSLSPDLRAKAGLFLGFQYPVEVAGVNFGNFLRLAINELRVEKGELKKLSPIAFRNQLEPVSKELGFADELSKRFLNQGFSGGEKKKAEILQLSMLKPAFAVLDEPDSGLDVDALRYIGKTINNLDYPLGLLLITHYQRILRYIKPHFVHVVVKGKIVKSGDFHLAKEIEEQGYEQFSI